MRSIAVLLRSRGIYVEREVPIRVMFRGVEVGAHRLDLLVENRIVVEIKSMERVPDLFKKQVRNYLAATEKELGLLINFGASVETHRILRPLRTRGGSRPVRPTSFGNSGNSENSDLLSEPAD